MAACYLACAGAGRPGARAAARERENPRHAHDLSDVEPEEGPHWTKHKRLGVGDTVIAPDGSESRILIQDTWNTATMDALAPEPEDLIVSNHRYSGFFETELDETLQRLGAKYLMVTGCTTSVADRDSSCLQGIFGPPEAFFASVPGAVVPLAFKR
jgi:nicotinamidase-related amidase